MAVPKLVRRLDSAEQKQSCGDRNVSFLELIVIKPAGSSHRSFPGFLFWLYRSDRGRVIGLALTPIVT